MALRPLRAAKVRVGRPSLDGHATWGIYKTKREQHLLLVIRLGCSVAKMMEWKPGTRISISFAYHGRTLTHLVLKEAPYVSSHPFPALRLRNKSSGTLQFQESIGVDGLFGVQGTQRIKKALPDKRGSALYIPVRD